MRLGMTHLRIVSWKSLGELATARGVNARRNGCERTAILAIIVGVGSARSTESEAVTTLIGSRRGVGASVIRIVIVEDHPAIAEGLTALLSIESDLTVVGVARDCDAADRLIAAQSPDVVLCDIRLAGTGDGLELLARRPAGPAFIMLSSYSYPSYFVAAVEHGAKGYLSKMATIEQIVASVRTVAAGGTAFPSDVRRTVRTALRPPTPREAQILALVAEGLGNAEIAERLSLRLKTIESQLRRMFDRYDVTSRTSLVRVAQRQGWIKAND